MADSIVEILNTSITSTELPTSTSSYDIITTDANTSYVIKDVQANGYASGLKAKINNFDVGDWSQTRTGSEIVDVSSTVSVSCENFPVDVLQIRASAFNASGNLGEDNLFGLVQKESVTTTFNTLAVASPIANIGNANVNTMLTVNDRVYQIYLDNNNTRYLYQWNTPSSRTILTTTGYAVLCLAEDQDAIYYRNSNSLRKVTLSTGDVTTINANVWPLPDSSSTYQRSAYCKDWLFELPSNSSTTYIYAINTQTGIYIKFSALRDMGSLGVGSILFVSYNEATDKFYVYRAEDGSSGDLSQDILPQTKTQMDAITTNTTISTSSTQTFIGGYTTVFPRDGRYFAEFAVGSQTDGNIFYFQHRLSNYNVFECDYSKRSSLKLTNRRGNGINVGSYLSVISPSVSQLDALNFEYNPYEIQLRITGVKTTTA